jgi:hypothetical protein
MEPYGASIGITTHLKIRCSLSEPLFAGDLGVQIRKKTTFYVRKQ